MFSAGTINTKGFWLGIVMIMGGVGLVCVGDTSDGVKLILGGVAMVVGRDTLQKVILNGSAKNGG